MSSMKTLIKKNVVYENRNPPNPLRLRFHLLFGPFITWAGVVSKKMTMYWRLSLSAENTYVWSELVM